MKNALLAILALILAGASPALADPGDAMQPEAYNRAEIDSGRLTADHVDTLVTEGARVVQARHGLAVDGCAGSRTRAALDAPAPPPDTDAHVWTPTGKGVFIRSLKHCGSPDGMLRRAAAAGLSWVSPLAIWQYTDEDLAAGRSRVRERVHLSFQDHIAALRDSELDVIPWGFPVPGYEMSFSDAMARARSAYGAPAVIIDPEAPYYDRGDLVVGQLGRELRSVMSVPIGVSSYGAPWFHGLFPWRPFAELADFGVPQAYDSRNTQPPEYGARSVAAYTELGFGPVVPALKAYRVSGPHQMATELAETPRPAGGVVWWDWYWLAQRPALWGAVAAAKV